MNYATEQVLTSAVVKGICDGEDRLGGRLGKLQPLPSLKSKCFLCARIHLVKMRLMFHLTIESNSRWEKKFEE